MCLFYLIEQYYWVRFTTYGFGKLSAFVIANVSRRRSDKTWHCMLLLVLTHIDTSHQWFVIEQVFCQCLGKLCLTYTSSTEEDERTDRTFRVLQSRTTTTYRIGYGFYRLILTYHTFVQLVFQMKQLFAFALQHLAHRYTCPAWYYIGNVFGGNLFLNHGIIALFLLQVVLNALDFGFQSLQLTVTNLGYTSVVALAFSTVGFELQLFYFFLVFLNLVYQCLFALPFSLVRCILFLQVGYLFVELRQLGFIFFALDGLAFYLKLFKLTFYFIHLFWQWVALHTQLGGCLIHQVDGFIRQVTIGDVTVAQFYRSDDGFVFDTHLMVVLVTLLQSSQDRDRTCRIRFINHNGLESTFQSFILFEILLIFIECSSTDASQFATSQCRFQDVGGIHCAFAFTCTYKCMNFIDEKDDVTIRLGDFVYDWFQTFLKLAFILGTGYKRTHVERIKLFVLQVFWNIATQYTLCQSFYDSGFTCTRFTYQDRVVLGTTTQYLQYTTNFFITTNYWVELTVAGSVYQVHCIFVKALISIFAWLWSYALSLSKFADGCTEFLVGHSGIFQNGSYSTLYVKQSQQNSFKWNIFVAQPFGVFYSFLQYLVSVAAQVGLASRNLRQRGNLAVEHSFYLLSVYAKLLENEVRYVFAHLQHTGKQMLRLDGLLSAALNQVHRFLHCLLRFDCKVVKVHIIVSFLFLCEFLI